jgi:signal transduction histidine kinase
VEVLPQENIPARALSPQDLGELMSAFNDVTAKLQRSHEKLHGEVARLTRELEDANARIERSRRLAALGEMAAGIAHEVRNPLGSIRLYARMLEEDLAPDSEPQGVARKIARSVTAIEQIVGDVLSFAREHRLHRTLLDLEDLIERSIEACAPGAHPSWRNVAIRRALSRTCPAIEGDAGLLQQALVNVIRNAMEAMEESPPVAGGHELVIAVEARTDFGGKVIEGVAIVVGDTGPGVTPEIVSRMFNPFFTTRSAGTGLGLSIVHRILDAHGGMVRVRNNKDLPGAASTARGACVELLIPGVREPRSAPGNMVEELPIQRSVREAESVRV